MARAQTATLCHCQRPLLDVLLNYEYDHQILRYYNGVLRSVSY